MPAVWHNLEHHAVRGRHTASERKRVLGTAHRSKPLLQNTRVLVPLSRVSEPGFGISKILRCLLHARLYRSDIAVNGRIKRAVVLLGVIAAMQKQCLGVGIPLPLFHFALLEFKNRPFASLCLSKLTRL